MSVLADMQIDSQAHRPSIVHSKPWSTTDTLLEGHGPLQLFGAQPERQVAHVVALDAAGEPT